SLHDPSKGEVVVGHARARGALPRPPRRQVIVGQVHDFELWHVAVAHVALKLGDPHIRTLQIERGQIERYGVGIYVGGQVALRHRPARIPLDHFAVVAESDALAGRERPQETPLRLVAFFAVPVRALAGVPGGHDLLTVVRHVRSGGPDVSLRTDLGVYEEAIEQPEAARQSVMVWSNGDVGEIDEAGVAVAFLHVSKHLIVSTVLFDDVDDVPEGRIAPRLGPTLPVIGSCDTLGEAC